MIITDKDRLKIPSSKVNSINEARDIIKTLEMELKNSKNRGIGLSGPQINIHKAVAIVRIQNPKNLDDTISIDLINPIIVEGDELIFFDEGCLSFPGRFVKTIRHKNIIVETVDNYINTSNKANLKRHNFEYVEEKIDLDKRRRIYVGMVDDNDIMGQFISVAIQHEISHLYGLTMYDFIPQSIGRNECCPCDSGRKNKKCCDIKYFNNNLTSIINRGF
jgi:peptide deformylase